MISKLAQLLDKVAHLRKRNGIQLLDFWDQHYSKAALHLTMLSAVQAKWEHRCKLATIFQSI